MRKALILTALAVLNSCSASHEDTGRRSVLLPSGQARHLVEQCSRQTPQDVDGVWTVPAATVQQLEQDLPKLSAVVSGDCCGKGSSVSNPGSYYRQYAGVLLDGKKHIYINAFPDHPIYLKREDKDRWLREAQQTCDGGEAFWGVLYNPETRQFSQLSFNGPG